MHVGCRALLPDTSNLPGCLHIAKARSSGLEADGFSLSTSCVYAAWTAAKAASRAGKEGCQLQRAGGAKTEFPVCVVHQCCVHLPVLWAGRHSSAGSLQAIPSPVQQAAVCRHCRQVCCHGKNLSPHRPKPALACHIPVMACG